MDTCDLNNKQQCHLNNNAQGSHLHDSVALCGERNYRSPMFSRVCHRGATHYLNSLVTS